MCSFRFLAIALLATNAVAAGNGYMIGAGVAGDSADGISAALLGGVGVTEKTWISVAASRSSVDLPRPPALETLHANLGVDHFIEPVGIRVGAAYWGDPDILDSSDWYAALYWRGARTLIEAGYEYRDFDFTIPETPFFPGRMFAFDADGLAVTARFDLGENLDLRLSATHYDYSVDFRPAERRDIVDLFSVSRLSLINSLVEHRAGLELGLDRGTRHWALQLSTWKGAVDGSRTRSVTLRYLLPLSARSDIELGLGRDDSDSYGDVTFFSLYAYFYGAD